ncbi:MAG: hypothetical protein LUC16_01970, partial [Coprobacillus sp.]|nr:hypothetical protein [Coprobacillus sp.]
GKAEDPEVIQIDPTQITSLSQDKDKVVFEMGKEKYQADMSLLQLMGMLSGHATEGNESIEVTTGDEVDKIKADLETALDQINLLTEQGEKSGAEISSRNAEITKLTSDKESLQAQLDEKIQESEEFLEKFDTLRDLAEKLINSYEAAKEQFESTPEDEGPSEKEEELAERLNEAEREKKDAEDEAEREKRVSSGLRGELATAKESLISVYSMTYGLSEEALRSSLGSNYPVRRIRAVAESMASQVSRFSGMPVLTGGPRKTVKATESVNTSDEVERELLEMIKNN